MKNLKLFTLFLAILMAGPMSACGQFMGIGSNQSAEVTARHEAGRGFDSGKEISATPSKQYSIEQRLDIYPRDGLMTSPHYNMKPGM